MRKLGLGALCAGICVAILGLAAVWTGSTASAAPSADEAATPKKADLKNVGRQVPLFILPDTNGKQVSVADYAKSKLLVVMFMGTECPIGNMYIPEMNELQKRYAGQGVQFLGINSNSGDSAEKIAEHVKEYSIEFPVLVDADQNALRLFDAQRTPEMYVLDGRRTILYRGRIDDRYGYIYKRASSRVNELQAALDEALAGKAVTVASTEPVGCLITRKGKAAATTEVTYANQISRLIQNRCQECHRAEMAAPFELTTYEDAVNNAEMIKEVIVQRRMPPWHADPRYGHFSNAMGLKQDEIDMLVSWVDNGTPLGDKSELPEAKEYETGWQIGKPDVVIEMPEEYSVPAEGTVEYQYFKSPLKFNKDVWVKAAEARPGNRAAVHHIILFARDPKKKKGDQRQGNRRRDERKEEHQHEGGSAENDLDGDWVATYAPGTPPSVLPDGLGRRIPKGAELIWQVHYTPTGKVEKDRSLVGLVFCDEPPQYDVQAAPLVNPKFKIPPGASAHEVRAEFELPKDAHVHSFLPHMHLRGKDFLYQAHYPDGRTEILLSVPSYDFNWQHIYRLTEPAQLPKGTKIECVAHYDNSAENPANPDPTAEVGWGDQTWEEMMIGYMDFTWAEPDRPAGRLSKNEK